MKAKIASKLCVFYTCPLTATRSSPKVASPKQFINYLKLFSKNNFFKKTFKKLLTNEYTCDIIFQ